MKFSEGEDTGNLEKSSFGKLMETKSIRVCLCKTGRKGIFKNLLRILVIGRAEK